MGDRPPEPLTPHQIRTVATKAYCDPRTVAAYLAAAPQNSNTRARVEDALRALGFEAFVRARACA